MAGVLVDIFSVLGVMVLGISLLLITSRLIVKRWSRNMAVSDDTRYAETLKTLSEASVRRSFDPYTDINWDAERLSVTQNDPRWVLTTSDPLGRHPWYRTQPLEKQIAIGMWRAAHIAKASLHLESILIRGLMQYSFWVPNGSPEYRYCLHESVKECNHSLMFREMVNRIGVNVPGMPWYLRWVSPLLPLAAGPLPNVFFFGVMAGEVPIDYLQKNMLREGGSLHPIVEKVMAIHVAEEARHIFFADAYLRKHVPRLLRISRFWLSLYVPVSMRVLCQATVPPSSFFKEFDIPRSVRKEVFFDGAEARQTLRNMFGDVRMLCYDVGLMNPFALLMWRLCKIDGRPSRYRSEPHRELPLTPVPPASDRR